MENAERPWGWASVSWNNLYNYVPTEEIKNKSKINS